MNCKRIRFSEITVLIVCWVLLLLNAGVALADVRVAAVISDNMVLQRGQKVSIWGWAEPGEEVMISVSWHSMRWAVTANSNGEWMFK
ncbi:MAG: sialate O-acetylesterase, partial [Candidatus Aminicenantes bacterium]|nr:sialate O-acetylesterase [Candidatus Aminicenantes bacterium]